MPPSRKSFKLFAYGTLMDPYVFRAVLGFDWTTDPAESEQTARPLAAEAVLTGYTKVSPDNTYLYAVPEQQGRIRGLLIGPLSSECIAPLREYEGKNYSRRRLDVQTAEGRQRAVVFVGNLPELQHAFGYEFHDELKQEVLLEGKIERALLETERDKLQTAEGYARRAVGELHGRLIRDLKRKHFDSGGISDYAIRTALKDEPLPDFREALEDPEAGALAGNYLSMVVRQVLFNQFEERVRREFRYELDHLIHSRHHYDRTLSSLVALRMVNRSGELMDRLVTDCLGDLSIDRDRLLDFVRWAIVAADATYDTDRARRHLRYVASHMGSGYISLGAELEFSNIGHGVIRDPHGREIRDARYDGFLYFRDFGLDVLTWKLGGHIDDHHSKSGGQRRRGFLEAALGNVSVSAELSKPITDDPWLLNQVIHETRRFFRVQPHSVHISLQLRTQHTPVRDRLMPLEVMKCLFAIAGDLQPREGDRWHVTRLTSDEVIDRGEMPHMLFSEVRKRYARESEDPSLSRRGPESGGKYVQQYRFPRLSAELNYEPIVLALKGVQVTYRPGTFLTYEQYRSSPRHREAFERLLDWGAAPEPISLRAREGFLNAVYRGLNTERRGRCVYSQAYVSWTLAELSAMIDAFNRKLVGNDAAPPARPGE